MGFTLPSDSKDLNGFCGPYDIDNKVWLSQSLVLTGYLGEGKWKPLNKVYYPGKLVMENYDGKVLLRQTLFYADKNHALVMCSSSLPISWVFSSKAVYPGTQSERRGTQLLFQLPHGECASLTFGSQDIPSLQSDGSYTTAYHGKASSSNCVVLSFYNTRKEMEQGLARARQLQQNPSSFCEKEQQRWNGYITSILRNDMPKLYDRIAVKSMLTLISNWKSAKGEIKHDGMCPSHATGNFAGGLWAWDTWQQAVATARFDPELAKSQIRSMFDYQDADGMIADCIFSDSRRNITETPNRLSPPGLSTKSGYATTILNFSKKSILNY